MAADYYLVLGIPEGATASEVHAAYRRLAKATHPDTSGRDSVRTFNEIQEAWNVLGDEQCRRRYDQERLRDRREASRARPQAAVRPRAAFSHRGGWLHLDLIISPDEIATGGVVLVELPEIRVCGYCRGHGLIMRSVCPACRGVARTMRATALQLEVPAGLRDGEVYQVPLASQRFCHRGLVIRVHVER